MQCAFSSGWPFPTKQTVDRYCTCDCTDYQFITLVTIIFVSLSLVKTYDSQRWYIFNIQGHDL